METQEWETLEELQVLHVVEEDNVLDPKELYKKISPYIDYEVFYAEDRIKQIKDNWDEELYVRCISTEKFRGQQVKKTTSALSENTNMTQHLDKLADYILYAHYNNEEQEEEYHRISQELEEKRSTPSKNRTPEDEKKIIDNQNKIKSRPRVMTRPITEKMRREDVGSLNFFFETENGLDREPSLFPAINYTSVDKELNQKGHFKNNQRYWAHFTPPKGNKIPLYTGEVVPYAKLAYETLDGLESDVKNIEKKLELVEFFRFLEKQRLNELDENFKVIPDEKGNVIEKFNPILEEKRKRLIKCKTQTRGEYNTAAEILRQRVTLSSSIYIQGEPVPVDAWERMSLRDPDTYAALILGYNELKAKYETKVGTTMWCIIHDFESMVKKVQLNEEEAVILEALLRDGKISDNAAQDEILRNLHKEIPTSTVNYVMNNALPNRFLELYEQQLEDWIWMYRRKGEYKTCKKCGEIKLIKHFGVQKTYKDGRSNSCKSCESKRTFKYKNHVTVW